MAWVPEEGYVAKKEKISENTHIVRFGLQDSGWVEATAPNMDDPAIEGLVKQFLLAGFELVYAERTQFPTFDVFRGPTREPIGGG